VVSARSAAAWLAAWLAASAVACGGGAAAPAGPVPREPTPPTTPSIGVAVTGEAVPGMASVDAVIGTLMRRWEIPGGAVAIVKDGRLVYARGFGTADGTADGATAPDALFRIASLSKPITAVAVLTLVEAGRLRLDAPAFALLGDLKPAPGATVDPRLAQITVRHLLQHSGGWDREASFDPMFRPIEAAQAVGAPSPASAETVVRYMLGRPLDFAPGARYAYSNFGYAVLGRIIERVSGMTYEQYVRTAVLAPMGIGRMRIGASLASGRAPGEVRYFDPATATSVFPGGGGGVSWPYGGFNLEAMDAHGGWIASTVDLMRFVTAVDALPTRPDVLQRATIDLMTAKAGVAAVGRLGGALRDGVAREASRGELVARRLAARHCIDPRAHGRRARLGGAVQRARHAPRLDLRVGDRRRDVAGGPRRRRVADARPVRAPSVT
jgi:N-acyl-D-amino-acid deacylase